jgi:hypothetical protein
VCVCPRNAGLVLLLLVNAIFASLFAWRFA